MTNRLNEYLKERPLLGGIVVLGILLIGVFAWAKIVQLHRPFTEIIVDPGLWLAFLIMAPVLYVSYVATAKYTR
ncbi:hypothetical protein DMJ13_19725 [halophilic archaeon]|nr:hypothetical protein DMJ13_19725 [halophilic archaeon]